MNIYFTITVFLLLATNYVIWNYIDYFKSQKDDKLKTKIDKLTKLQNYIFYILIILIAIGFILYTKEQYSVYKKNWSIPKFLFGTKKCKSKQ